MEYNTKRGDMMFREYGRTIKKIIDNVCETPEGEERNEAARAIVTAMAQVGGLSLRDDVVYHKLWDHLMIMSDFRLESAWPFGQEELEQLKERNNTTGEVKRERLPYKNRVIESRHYGEYLESMLRHLKDIPDGEEYNTLITLVAQQAKRSYLVWNGELSDDNIVVEQMARISGDERVLEYLKDKPITVPHNTLPVETSPTKKKKKRK
ncbi:MAG: DUF4290 domain-containing protein [Bacteroidales bacterium]|nr:DUF4290 domain-containing protein [Bacteroidales bacterium]